MSPGRAVSDRSPIPPFLPPPQRQPFAGQLCGFPVEWASYVLIGRDHFVSDPGHSGHIFGKREQRLAFLLRADEPPQMHDAVANGEVSVPKTGPRLVLESRQ